MNRESLVHSMCRQNDYIICRVIKKPLPCGRGFSFIGVRWFADHAIAMATAGASPGTHAEAERAVSKAVRAAMIACPMA